MTDLTVSVNFTKNVGQPATVLTLSEINLWLTQQDRATGALTVIWDGTQNPTEEVSNTGHYSRRYTGADLDKYNYYAAAQYTGATSLDQDWVTGAVGDVSIPIGTAVEFTYTVQESDTTPIEGVRVEVHRNATGTDIYRTYWTDAFGVARDEYGDKPRLDPGDWYFWRIKGGWSFDNPDTEVVS